VSEGNELVSVVLPTYNERENIGLLIEGILAHVRPPVEVIVVDDNSPDGTWQLVQETASRDPRVALLRRTNERGLTTALVAGIGQARGALVAWMDCDLSMPPEVLPRLIQATREADLAVGSRYLPGGADVGHSLPGRSFSRTINLAASLFLGRGITDWTSGFLVVRRPVFDRVSLRGDYGEYCIDLLARARRLGFTVREIPYRCVPRQRGESKTATNVMGYFRRGFKYVVTIVRLWLEGLRP
jgi:glycosyltransferase involved in cell wall biosynthesis